MKGNTKMPSRLPVWVRKLLRASIFILAIVFIVAYSAVLITKNAAQDVDEADEPFNLNAKKCPANPDPIGFVSARGGHFSNVEVKTFSDGIRGMASRRRITKGGIMAQIPKSLTFTYATAGGNSDDAPAEEQRLRTLWQGRPDMLELDRLTLMLLYLYSLPSTRWDHYLCTIPKPHEMGPPVMWSKKRLSEYCRTGKYKTLCHWIDLRHDYYKKIYEKEVVGIAKDFPDLFPGNVLSYRNYLWAATAVSSRFWNMCDACYPRFDRNGTILTEPKYLMGPAVDLFNHKRNSGYIQWGVGRDSNMFQVVTKKPLEPGDQAFISYGDKCNLSLLLEYGFTIPNNPELCEGDEDETPTSGEAKVDGAQKAASNEGLLFPASKGRSRVARTDQKRERQSGDPAHYPEPGSVTVLTRQSVIGDDAETFVSKGAAARGSRSGEPAPHKNRTDAGRNEGKDSVASKEDLRETGASMVSQNRVDIEQEGSRQGTSVVKQPSSTAE